MLFTSQFVETVQMSACLIRCWMWTCFGTQGWMPAGYASSCPNFYCNFYVVLFEKECVLLVWRVLPGDVSEACFLSKANYLVSQACNVCTGSCVKHTDMAAEKGINGFSTVPMLGPGKLGHSRYLLCIGTTGTVNDCVCVYVCLFACVCVCSVLFSIREVSHFVSFTTSHTLLFIVTVKTLLILDHVIRNLWVVVLFCSGFFLSTYVCFFFCLHWIFCLCFVYLLVWEGNAHLFHFCWRWGGGGGGSPVVEH